MMIMLIASLKQQDRQPVLPQDISSSNILFSLIESTMDKSTNTNTTDTDTFTNITDTDKNNNDLSNDDDVDCFP